MREKWNEFVFDLCEAQNRNAEESEYHYIIESQLKLFIEVLYDKPGAQDARFS